MKARNAGILEGLERAVKAIQAQQDALAKNRLTMRDFDRGAEAAFGMALYVVMTEAQSVKRAMTETDKA